MKPVAYIYTCRNPGQAALLWSHQPPPFGHGWIDVKRVGLVREDEVEALRRDAERYRWLRDNSESIHQFYLSTPIWFTGVKFNKENVDGTIDAAIAAQGVTP